MYVYMYVCTYIPMCVVCNRICTWYVIIYVFVQCTGMSGPVQETGRCMIYLKDAVQLTKCVYIGIFIV